MGLSRDQILGAKDTRVQEVPVPEWGGSVYVRVLSGTERDALELRQWSDKPTDRDARMANWRARWCSLAICDAEGTRLFADADIPRLGQKSAAALDRVYEAALKLNAARASDVEELEKNLPSAPSASSGSA